MFTHITKDSNRHSLFEILAKGGVVIMPCDTVYGLVGVVPGTVRRIGLIKGRPEGKDYLQLILPGWLPDFSAKPIDNALLSFCPGKITFIVENLKGIKTAIRFPEDNFIVELLEFLKKPLYSTSVNRSGSPFLWRSKDILDEFGMEIDAFLDIGDIPESKPSTILDITTSPYKIIRAGACDLSSLPLTG